MKPAKPSDESVTTEPPHNYDAEKAVVGACLLDAKAIQVASVVLRPDDFWGRASRLTFDALLGLHLAGKPCDPVSVLSEVDRRGHTADVGGREWFIELAHFVESAANVRHHADLVIEAAKKRAYYFASIDLREAALNGKASEEISARVRNAVESIDAAFAGAAPDNLFGAIQMTDADRTPWLVRGYLARRAVTLLTALPKLGKTTLAYAIVAAIQRGDATFCGLAMPEKDVEVLVMTEEDDSVLAETFRAVRVDPARAPAVTRRKAFPRRPLAVDVDAALAMIAKNPRIGLIIIDTWRFWANLPDKGSNDADMVGRAFQQVARLAAAGVAVLLIHHSRKSDGEDGTAASGSNALTGAVDVIMELRRFGKSESASMRTIKAYGRFQRIPDELVVDFQDGGYVSCGDASEARDRQQDTRVLTCLVNSARWLTDDEIEAATGMKTAHLVKTLRSLFAKKAIQRAGKGARGSKFLYASLDVPLHTQPVAQSPETQGETTPL